MDIAALGASPNADAICRSIRELGLEPHVLDLQLYGFTVIPPEKVASPEFAERLRNALVELHERRIARGEKVDIFSHHCLFEDPVIQEAALNRTVLAMARFLCGRSAILSLTSDVVKNAATAAPDLEGSPFESPWLPLHCDTPGVPPPMPQYAQACNTSWILTDYESDADGPTVIVPGSHLIGHGPNPAEAQFWLDGAPVKPVSLAAKAGSLAVWHGNAWHGSIPRTNPGPRVTMIYYWCRPYIQPASPWQGNTPPEVIEAYPELEQILGLKHPYHRPYFSAEKMDLGQVAALSAAGVDQFG